jgi:hypothetical protein
MDHRVRRPVSVTLLAVLVLTIGGINLIRVAQTLLQWSFLEELLPISPAYFALTGFFWGLLGLVLVWGLWRGETWAPKLLRVSSLIYVIYIWVDRLLVRDPSSRSVNELFSALLMVIVLVIIFLILSRRNAKVYFGEAYEQRSEN